MKTWLILLAVVALSGCATNGYNPSYIISETQKEETKKQKEEIHIEDILVR